MLSWEATHILYNWTAIDFNIMEELCGAVIPEKIFEATYFAMIYFLFLYCNFFLNFIQGT
jgi:hypothetical protein